jgi:5-dehydro-2-deoxygluconokinase
VLLGLNADIDVLTDAFRKARGSATCRGFAVGRTVFQQPSAKWLSGAIDDAALKRAIRTKFEALIDAWQEARAPLTTAQSWDECKGRIRLSEISSR